MLGLSTRYVYRETEEWTLMWCLYIYNKIDMALVLVWILKEHCINIIWALLCCAYVLFCYLKKNIPKCKRNQPFRSEDSWTSKRSKREINRKKGHLSLLVYYSSLTFTSEHLYIFWMLCFVPLDCLHTHALLAEHDNAECCDFYF